MVQVKLFGTLRLDTGVRELEAEAGTVRELLPILAGQLAALAPAAGITEKELRACLIAVNGEQASLRTKLKDGDLVCLFPAVAGG